MLCELKARVRAHLELSLEPRAKGPQRERETNPNTRAIRHDSSLLVYSPPSVILEKPRTDFLCSTQKVGSLR